MDINELLKVPAVAARFAERLKKEAVETYLSNLALDCVGDALIAENQAAHAELEKARAESADHVVKGCEQRQLIADLRAELDRYRTAERAAETASEVAPAPEVAPAEPVKSRRAR